MLDTDFAAEIDTKFEEPIRLVIWDLDETFWSGTIVEGGISIIDENCNIVVELAKRGIISSISSKNEHESVKKILQDRGLWDYFVFPSIDWNPKGPRIRQQIEAIGLRPPTVLFIDDNPHNLSEVADLVPGINIADPSIIPQLLSHPSLKGKDDHKFTRLEQYRALERKSGEMLKAKESGEALDFLRKSDIRIYFEYELEDHVDRVIELINRTNQLNFTKKRLPEDIEEARRVATLFIRDHGVTAGLIRVVDKYGDYGFVGFYAMRNIGGNYYLEHFCFSCRTLNMYVEHRVYDFIGRPALNVVGEVLSDVKQSDVDTDWIQICSIKDIAAAEQGQQHRLASIFARGGCDIQSQLHYFSLVCNDIKAEFNLIKNDQSLRVDHSSFLCNSLKGLTPEQLKAAESLGYEKSDFVTQFPRDRDVSLCILSFWADADIPFYRHIETGLEVPYWLIGAGKENLIKNDEVIERLKPSQIQKQRIAHLRSGGWEYVVGLTQSEMTARYRWILSQLPEATPVVLLLANEKHPPCFASGVLHEDHVVYNRALRAAAKGFPNVHLIDPADFLRDANDLADINHFRREIYFQMYERIMEKIFDTATSNGGTAAAQDKRRIGEPRPAKNLALGCAATQSSICSWSRHQSIALDAEGPINGKADGTYSHHTDTEDDPWWQVDLGRVASVEEIRIFNRIDFARDRFRNFVIRGSLDGKEWFVVHTKNDNFPFGGLDGCPFIWRAPKDFVTLRYLRIQGIGHTRLDLDQVEVY